MVLWIVLSGHLPFYYWDNITIDIMSYVDFLYGDGTVLHQIFSYVRYESGHPWPPHMLLKFYWFA